MGFEKFSVLGLVLSTVAFFVARHYISRYMEETGMPKGMTRSMVVFVGAMAVSYGVWFVVDWVVV